MKKKLISILVALAMMVVCAIPAFAAEASKSSAVGTDATVGLTKTLTVPAGTTIPSNTFSFKIARVTTNAADESYDVTSNVTYPQNTEAKAATAAGSEATASTATQIINYNDILSGAEFEAAGVYAFDVTENAPVIPEDSTTESYAAPTYTKTTTADGVTTTETIKYSQAKYRLIVGVASYTKADGTTGYYIDTIQAIQLLDDDGEDAGGEKPNGSLNPAPGEAGAINFTNNYLKTKQDPDPLGGGEEGSDTKDGQTLYIDKEITLPSTLTEEQAAEIAIDNDKVFQFTATVTFPDGANNYKYNIVNAAGENQLANDVTVAKPAAGNSATFTFELKNGQRLVFTDIAIGATWTVTEATYPAYTANITTSNNGLVKDTGGNKSEVKNEYDKDKDPATGLSISNLPFIVLALVAIGGLCAYVIVRRKADDEA